MFSAIMIRTTLVLVIAVMIFGTPAFAASTGDSTAIPADTLRRIDPDDFTFAGNPRVTPDGELPAAKSQINTTTASIVGGFYVGAMVGLHIYHVNTVWKDTSGAPIRFRFVEDGDYALYADKTGHFWSSYFNSYLATEVALAAGFSYESAVVIGSLMGLGVQTYIEIGDGFGKHWGFSPSDMASNLLGAGWYIGQYYFPPLQNFMPKYTYVHPPLIDQPHRPDMIAFWDNYNGAIDWMAVNIDGLLPAGARDFWPDWLQIAVGYAARDLGYPEASTRYIVALDYDIVRLLPDGGTFWNWAKQTLNMWKFPAPALEVGPHSAPRFRLLYPF
jgi:hypothetical protein